MADVKLRTKEELLHPDYNYYIYFKISPTEKDVAKIEKAIVTEKNKWTQGLPIQRRMKELYTDIENVMLKDMGYDPATGGYTSVGARAKELDRARNLKLKSAMDLVVSMCNNKGRLYKSDLTQIAGYDKISYYTLADLEKAADYLFKQGIQYIDDTQSVIDFRKYKDIEDFLVTAQQPGLYALLQKDPKASIAQLNTAIKEVYSNLRDKTGPKGTATDKLLGIAKSVFKTEETKKQYDNYLAIKESVWDHLQLRRSQGIKSISMDEFLGYAETIKATLHMTIDEVEVYLAAGLKQFKLIVVSSDDVETKNVAGEVIHLELCPYSECGKAYRDYPNKAVKSCPHCGKPLEIICWNCGGKMPFTSKSKTCPACGSTQQSKTLFDSRQADLEKTVRCPGASVIEMQSALTNLINAVPNYKAYKTGFAAKKIAEFEKIIADKIKEEEKLGSDYRNDVQKIRTLINGKNYLQAKSAALNLRRTYGSYNESSTNGLISDIDRVMRQAEAHLQSAKTYAAQRNVAMTISFAAKALDLCADYNEARLLMQKYPPEAPRSVKASLVKGSTVRIEWETGSDRSMTTYTVVKKVGSRPTSVDDGRKLESNLTIQFYEDTNIVSATNYYYGVFAERYGIHSAVVSTPAPIAIYKDVSGVQQEMVDTHISVKWDCPHNVKAIEIWKKPGPVAPTAVGDGVKIAANGLSGFADRDNSRENSYLILCVYEVNGLRKYSRGVQHTFKRYEMLRKPEHTNIVQHSAGEYQLTYTGSSGKIKLLATKERLSCRLDTIYPMLDYNSICKGCTLLGHRAVGDQSVDFTLPEGQVLWVYPMICNEQLFMLSKPFLLNNVKGIRNLSCQEDQGTVRIKGMLHGETRQLIVKIDNSDFPQTVEDGAEQIVVSRDRFMNEGGITLKLRTNTVNYISVFAQLEKDGAKTISYAAKVSDKPIDYREKVVVQCALDYKISSTKSFQVTAQFASEVPLTLPRICLVKGYPTPLTKGDGEPVEIFPAIALKKRPFSSRYTAKVTVSVPPCMPRTKFVLFSDDDSVKYVQLKAVNHL